MAQFEFDGILLETGLLQTGFHAAGLSRCTHVLGRRSEGCRDGVRLDRL